MQIDESMESFTPHREWRMDRTEGATPERLAIFRTAPADDFREGGVALSADYPYTWRDVLSGEMVSQARCGGEVVMPHDNVAPVMVLCAVWFVCSFLNYSCRKIWPSY